MKNTSIVLVFTVLAAMASCRKDADPTDERFRIVKEKEHIEAGINSVRITGQYAYSGKIDGMKLRLATEESLAGANDHSVTVSDSTYSVEVTGLESGTTYYYRYLVDYGSVADFATEIDTFRTTNDFSLPTVATIEVRGVSFNAASCLCHVADDGGAAVTERGACWSLRPNPSITDVVFANGSGLGDYIVDMPDLDKNTTYYVRAYAKNAKGVGYGDVLSFTTLNPYEAPEGAVSGRFTVNASGDQVWFSQGNLRYRATTNTWAFAETQFECVGNDNLNVAEGYDGWIDLFAWGTSGYDHGAVCYQPWCTSDNVDDYWAYGDINAQLYDQTGMADWGFNSIENGGNAENLWRTPKMDEWLYLFHERATPSGIRFAKAQVEGMNGVILLPDDWSAGSYYLNNVNQEDAAFGSNVVTELAWNFYLEGNGAVFLPAAGRREEGLVEYVGNRGYYHSSECRGDKYMWNLIVKNYIGEETLSRFRALAVRLVRDVESR